MIKRSSAFIAIALFSGTAFSAEIKFRGFASFVGGTTLASDETLYGYTDALDFQEDSLIALQAEATISDKTTAVMQLLARGNGDYEPKIEWAYLTHKLTDTLTVNAGRMRIPFYRFSDFIDVRYAYNWINVPQTVYGFQLPGYDGVSVLSTNMIGNWESSLQVIFGQLTGEFSAGDVRNTVPGDLENLTGGAWTLTRDWLTLRTSYITSKATLNSADISGLANLIGGLGAATSTDVSNTQNSLLVEGDQGEFIGFALGIDYENFLLDAETIKYRLSDSLTPKSEAWYVTAGYRFGALVPHLTYSELSSEGNDRILNDLAPGLANIPVADLDNATVMQILGGAVAGIQADTKITSLGVRYDVKDGMALKLEVTHQEDITGNESNLLRFGADIVF